MRFLADMGVSGSTVRSLRALGHEATHLREEGLMRLPDPQILEKSREEGRILLTFDLGFGELLAASRQELPSTVIFRVRDATPSSVTQKLVAFLSAAGEELSRGAVVVIEDTRFHLRRLPLKKAKS